MPSDSSYQPKVQTQQGGTVLAVASGGSIQLDSGASLINSGISQFGGAAAAAASAGRLIKPVTAIADNVFTDVVTVTVPNAAHSANIKVSLIGSLGAGGAIGANEASNVLEGNVVVARTAGVNAVATASAAGETAGANVAGAATITLSYQLSAIAGAVGAVNTFTIQVRVTKSGGASAAHTCLVVAEVMNANAAGVTIA